jgi:hypothetical protein
MSGTGPQPYPVVYDAQTGLQYVFETGNIIIPTGGSSPIPNTASANRVSQTTITLASQWVATGIKLTITPSSSTAKIYVSAYSLVQNIGAGMNEEYFLTIFRDTTAAQGAPIVNGTNISLDPSPGILSAHSPITNTNQNEVIAHTLIGIDTPGSATPHTYTVAFWNNGLSDSWDVGERGQIQAFEIH